MHPADNKVKDVGMLAVQSNGAKVVIHCWVMSRHTSGDLPGATSHLSDHRNMYGF